MPADLRRTDGAALATARARRAPSLFHGGGDAARARDVRVERVAGRREDRRRVRGLLRVVVEDVRQAVDRARRLDRRRVAHVAPRDADAVRQARVLRERQRVPLRRVVLHERHVQVLGDQRRRQVEPDLAVPAALVLHDHRVARRRQRRRRRAPGAIRARRRERRHRRSGQQDHRCADHLVVS